MAIRPIISIPDPRLRLVSRPVEKVDDEIRTLLDDMLETMYDAPGIGLAAIQIAVDRRVLVLDIARKDEPPQPLCVINPEIIWSSEESNVHEEGCLSIPEYYEEVERPERIRVRYLDRDGQAQEIEADGLLATAMQHEIDHLNGKLFIDYLKPMKRQMITRRMQKLKREKARG